MRMMKNFAEGNAKTNLPAYYNIFDAFTYSLLHNNNNINVKSTSRLCQNSTFTCLGTFF